MGDLDGVVPEFSGDMVLFITNEAGWASFVVLVFAATFVRWVIVLPGAYAI